MPKSEPILFNVIIPRFWYRKEIKKMSQQLDELQASVAELGEADSELKTVLEGVATKLDALEKEVETLKNSSEVTPEQLEKLNQTVTGVVGDLKSASEKLKGA